MIDIFEDRLNFTANDREMHKWMQDMTNDAIKKLKMDEFQIGANLMVFAAHLFQLHRRKYYEE